MVRAVMWLSLPAKISCHSARCIWSTAEADVPFTAGVPGESGGPRAKSQGVLNVYNPSSDTMGHFTKHQPFTINQIKHHGIDHLLLGIAFFGPKAFFGLIFPPKVESNKNTLAALAFRKCRMTLESPGEFLHRPWLRLPDDGGGCRSWPPHLWR